MKALRFFLFVLLLTSTRLLANNLPPESVIEPIPNRSWLYNGEWAFFNGASSYDRDENGNSITNYYWHIRIGSGSYVQKSSGSSATNYSMCFELGGTAYATTSNGCIAMGSSTTATVRLKVYDDEGSYDYGYSTVTIKTPAQSRYFITDHLGNIRTTINEDGEAMGADDYFPFGLIMPGRSNTTANANDLYKYTSHERDDEAVSDALDYMLARNYDPTLGRMNQIDPMASMYPSMSPFAYSLNNPVMYLDPTGNYVVRGTYVTRITMNRLYSGEFLSFILPGPIAEGGKLFVNDPTYSPSWSAALLGGLGKLVKYGSGALSKTVSRDWGQYISGFGKGYDNSMTGISFLTDPVLDKNIVNAVYLDEVLFNVADAVLVGEYGEKLGYQTDKFGSLYSAYSLTQYAIDTYFGGDEMEASASLSAAFAELERAAHDLIGIGNLNLGNGYDRWWLQRELERRFRRNNPILLSDLNSTSDGN